MITIYCIPLWGTQRIFLHALPSDDLNGLASCNCKSDHLLGKQMFSAKKFKNLKITQTLGDTKIDMVSAWYHIKQHCATDVYFF